MRRLAGDVRLDLDYDDETPFGSALGGGADHALRQACTEIFPLTGSMDDLVRRSRDLLSRAFERDLASRYLAPEKLREECLYPAAERVRPRALIASREDQPLVTIGIEPEAYGELAKWISEFQRGTERPSSSIGQALYDLLNDAGAFTELVERSPEPEMTFVGHATAMLGDRILVDPFLLPKSSRYPASYQPLGPEDVLPVNAVLITHSHPDHFDPGTLLRLGAETPIYVPHVERESLLSVDMAMRLEQLGFSCVRRVRPGDELAIGKSTVHVLPFFGEQPTTGDSLHPEVRNVGCTYSVVSPERHVLVLADSGRDREGDVRDLASEVRRKWGAPDILLGGYRGFAVYPIQWLFSSVARYLLFVPEHERTVRQVTMNDCDALIDTAERCGAKRVVPYADGGAPWYWERGLGPRLDGHGIVNASADPPLEEVVRTASKRSTWGEEPIGSAVPIKILRPGQRLGDGAGAAWPYRSRVWHQYNVALKRVEGSAMESLRTVFRALEPLIAAWRKEGRLEHFFYMRKAPDVRLRFYGDDSLDDELATLFRSFAERSEIEHTFTSPYEPETARFGGPKAMDAVHAWFDVDTRSWAKLDELETRGFHVPNKLLMASAVADDLVSRVITDTSEAWAVWRTYASSYALEEPRDATLLVTDLETLTSNAHPDVQPWLAPYRVANRELANELANLASHGQLEAGLRGILIGVVMFHLNRYGFAPTEHAQLVWSMIRTRDPQRKLMDPPS